LKKNTDSIVQFPVISFHLFSFLLIKNSVSVVVRTVSIEEVKESLNGFGRMRGGKAISSFFNVIKITSEVLFKFIRKKFMEKEK